MSTIEEMTAWTLEETRAEIHAMLPAGWRFEFLDERTQWRASFFGLDGEVLWWNTYADQRLLLFDAYGWLWKHQNKTAVHPAWVPRDRPRLTPVYKVSPHVAAAASDPSDPEDLNPAEINAVYSDPRRPT